MKRVFRGAVSVLVVFLVAVVVAGMGIYRFHYDSRFTSIMKSMVPYPALLVNGEFLSVQDYERERRFASDFVNFQQQRLTGQTLSAQEEKQFLASLPEYIQNRILWKQMAIEKHVNVTAEDIESMYQSALLDLGGASTLETFLTQHGYTSDTFKINLIEPAVYREKITDALTQVAGDVDEASVAAQKSQAFTSAYQDFRNRSYVRTFYSE